MYAPRQCRNTHVHDCEYLLRIIYMYLITAERIWIWEGDGREGPAAASTRGNHPYMIMCMYTCTCVGHQLGPVCCYELPNSICYTWWSHSAYCATCPVCIAQHGKDPGSFAKYINLLYASHNMYMYMYMILLTFYTRRKTMWVSSPNWQNWNLIWAVPTRRGMQSGGSWSQPVTNSQSHTPHWNRCRSVHWLKRPFCIYSRRCYIECTCTCMYWVGTCKCFATRVVLPCYIQTDYSGGGMWAY